MRSVRRWLKFTILIISVTDKARETCNFSPRIICYKRINKHIPTCVIVYCLAFQCFIISSRDVPQYVVNHSSSLLYTVNKEYFNSLAS